MENIISWYVWWQKTKEIKKKNKETEIVIIEERQTREFSDPRIMTGFEEGKKYEGYETDHGYYLEIP